MMALLLACAGKDDADSGETDTSVTLAAPHVAIVTPMEYGQLRSTCQVTVEVTLAGDTTSVVGSATYNARGGDWVAGFDVEPGVQYDAVGRYDDCINTGEVTGSFDAGNFSLEEGALFLFWYAGTSGGFDTLLQETNFVGGTGYVAFEDEFTPTSDDVGLTDNGDGTWTLAYDESIPVSAALEPFSTQEGFVYAEPDWLLNRPDWWQR